MTAFDKTMMADDQSARTAKPPDLRPPPLPGSKATGRDSGRRPLRWILAGSALLLLIVVVGAWLVWRSLSKQAMVFNAGHYTVTRGPLVISVKENGTIKPRNREIIKAEVEGQTTILYLIPEGTVVQQGTLLVELDASRMKDMLVDEQIKLRNAEASLVRARENLEVVKSQAASEVAKAALEAQFAKEDERNYREGEFPKLLKEAESKVTLAGEEAQRAREKLKWSETLAKEHYLSQTELDGDRLALRRAELDNELASASKQLLQDFNYKRKLDELKSNAEQTAMALDRVTRKGKADVIQAEADLSAKQSEHERQKEKVEKLTNQIRKTRMYAPRDGMVVYATSVQGSRWNSPDPLTEGQNVRERQDLIYLPTTSSFVAEIKVRESTLDKVKLGLPARLTIEAMVGKTYTGRVTRISPMPEANWMDMKTYPTEILLDTDDEALRTGMSCKAEIIIDQYDDALFVPVQAVVRSNGTPMVFVVKGGNLTPRTVTLGLDNNSMVHILDGLKEGEVVTMSPPLDTAAPPAPPMRLPPATRRATTGPSETNGSGNEQNGATTRPDDSISRRMANLSEEDREKMRKTMESMTPQERQRAREQFIKSSKSSDGGRGRPNLPAGGNR